MKQAKSLILAAAASVLLATAVPCTALAAHLTGASNWSATYNSSGRMEETYNAQEYVDQVGNLQPGDDITFEVSAIHDNETSADWYVSNDVIKSLEEQALNDAEGSNYEYLLTWQGPKESRTLYDSQAVGGDDSDGLNEATEAMEDFIFLENMSKGQTGKVTIKVTLDGETEGNAYFDTLAKLKVRFAVEPVEPEKKTTSRTTTNTVTNNRELVRTGDDTKLFPFYVAMFVSGVLLLALAIISLRERRKEQEEAAR